MKEPRCYEVDMYYDKVIRYSVDERIRNKCIELANKVADDIIKQYKVSNIIRRTVNVGLKKKFIIALELERKPKC